MADPSWVALSLLKHLGGKTFRALLFYFDHDLSAILQADLSKLRHVPGIGAKIAHAIQTVDVQAVALSMDRWQKAGIHILTWNDSAYPPCLRALDDAPPTLFVKGILPTFERAAAIVGTRSPTTESRELAQNLAVTLIQQGYLVVSGLALGIDTAAHLGALAVPEGRTCAVLGCGILNIYPTTNHSLAQAITQRGALLCEVSPDSAVSIPGLVARNRIITGLCEALIVVQTEIDGGAMHAARFAKLQGKTIYAVDNQSGGNQQLITEGAIPIAPDLKSFTL